MKDEQEKLKERAKRFSLPSKDIRNFTEIDANILYISLGIGATIEKNVRFEVIHLRGFDQMSAGDILDYFMDFAPSSVEWIDEECCNVVFMDKAVAARALHFLSKAVRGMPVRDDSCYFFGENLQDSVEIDKSALFLNKDREIELLDDEDTDYNKLLNTTNSVDISEIASTIPPGYWRLGKTHPKSKCILVRFSLKTDKQAVKVEQLSRFYKGQTKKNTPGIFGRNKEMHKSENPWSVLAKNWDEDTAFREKSPIFTSEISKLNVRNRNLQVRLGSKRKEEADEEEEEEEPEESPSKPTKIPRMRMYADDEEEKIKRKLMLKKLSGQMKKLDENTTANSDLRTVLNLVSRTNAGKKEKSATDDFDLGSRLKNRNRKMVFQIKTEREYTARTERVRRHSSEEEDTGFRSDRYIGSKPRSKVAVVVKNSKKPAVASAIGSTIWSRVGKVPVETHSDSEESSVADSSESDKEAEDAMEDRRMVRPGFTTAHRDLKFADSKKPLKIEINNDHYRRN